MRISADIVGREIVPGEQRVDARWLMAYSAGLGETDFPHPLFPVCYEWPATRQIRERAGLAPIDAGLVHAQHDLTIHRPPKAEALRVSGKVVAALQRRPGALDRAYARAAGLPDIILHGTATLALSISNVLQAFKADPLAVRRARCRFSGMVLMPNTLQVCGVVSGNRIFFETRNAAGELVVSRASIDLDGRAGDRAQHVPRSSA